jgi:hypothetical protein
VYNRAPTVAVQEHVIFTCQNGRQARAIKGHGSFRGGESDRFVSAGERAPTRRPRAKCTSSSRRVGLSTLMRLAGWLFLPDGAAASYMTMITVILIRA